MLHVQPYVSAAEVRTRTDLIVVCPFNLSPMNGLSVLCSVPNMFGSVHSRSRGEQTTVVHTVVRQMRPRSPYFCSLVARSSYSELSRTTLARARAHTPDPSRLQSRRPGPHTTQIHSTTPTFTIQPRARSRAQQRLAQSANKENTPTSSKPHSFARLHTHCHSPLAASQV